MGKTELIITIILFNLFFLIFIIAIFVYIKRYRYRRKEHINELRLKNQEHQKALLAAQLEIQKVTMAQIGRELHDNIGQNITLASLYTQKMLYDNTVPQVQEEINQVVDILNNTLVELRSLSHSLTNDRIADRNIIELIEDEVNKTNALKKCKVHLNTQLDENEDLNILQKTVLIRTIQEFIQNSLKHAQCKNIFVTLVVDKDGKLLLELKDDGVGFDLSESQMQGIGLKNMKKRTEILDGTYHLYSQKGIGTLLTINLNLK